MAFRRETYVPGVEGRVLVVTDIIKRTRVLTQIYRVDEEGKPVEALLDKPAEDITPKKGWRRHRELCRKYDRNGDVYIFDNREHEKRYVPVSPRLYELFEYVGISRLSRE